MSARRTRAVPWLVALGMALLALGMGTRPAGAQHTTPTIDGTIGSGEYGDHTNGQNQETNGSQVWYMTWDDTNLYVGISGADLGEGAILYLDKNPLAPINGGADTDGTIVGFNYDSTSFAALQFRADVVLYVKDSYREYRTANGSNGWSDATTGWGSYAGNSNTREFALPWSAIGGRPAAFAWFGYLTSGSGYVYGTVPTENAGGNIGTSARYARYYIVNNTGDGTSVKPFSRNSYVFNSDSDLSGFGALSVYDFTMNTSSRTLTRGGDGGAWTIGGDMRVDNGTVSFGAVSTGAAVTGQVVVGSGGTLALSSVGGGDLSVGGNWSNNGTFTCNGRQVTFNGSGAQSIGGSATNTFDWLLIDNAAAGEVTLGSNITVRRQLKINDSSAELSAGSATITMLGDADNGPIFWNEGYFNRGTGTVVFTGDGVNNKHARVWGSPPVVTTFNNVAIGRVAGGSGNFGVDFYDHSATQNGRAHIAGTLTLNANTFVASEEDGSGGGCASVTDGCDGTPTYDSGSTLVYNNGGSFDSGAEWWPDDSTPTCGSDKGMPYNVTIANNTALNINAAFANGGQSPNYAAGSNKTACGTVTIYSGSTLQSTAGILSVKGDWTRGGTFIHNGGTVRFNGAVGTGNCQTVSGDTTFYNLTINPASGAVCFGATTTTIAHDLEKSGGGTMDSGTGKFIFTGSPSAILGSGEKNFYDVEISATTNHTTGGSVRVRHSFVNNGAFNEGADQNIYFAGGGNISLSGSGTTTLGRVWVQSASILNAGTHSFRVVGTYFAVYGSNTFNGGTATVNFANGTGTALNGSLTNLGTYNFNNVTIESGAVVLGPQYGSKSINVAGDWTNNGTYIHKSGTVVLNGSGAQTLGGNSSTTFANLTVNNSSADADGVTLAADQKVTGTLTLTDGLVKVEDKTLTIGPAGSISGGSAASMVVTHEDGSETGALCKEYPDGENQDPAAFTFPVGDIVDGTDYSTATLDFADGSDFNSGKVCVRVTDAKHPNNNSPLHYLTRYWTVTSGGISGFSCAATFTYVDADIVGTEASLIGLKYDSPAWTPGGPVNASRNNFQMTVSSFSDFTAGNNPTAVKLLSFAARPASWGVLLTWETAGEWNNAGFHLYRSTAPDDVGARLNGRLIPARVPGGDQGARYTWLDETAAPGRIYYYTLEDVDFSGQATPHGPLRAALWRACLPVVGR